MKILIKDLQNGLDSSLVKVMTEKMVYSDTCRTVI